ncbi:MAG: prolipoprotein diacylglyceryl transferase [Odoribacter splanchnicus]
MGHCIFYDWAYCQYPLEMILPVRFSPEFKFWLSGLASHGAAIGIIAGLWYSRKVSKILFWILDRAVIPIALAGFFIRTGNLMNSEIVGLPTNMPWGFRFMNSDLPNPELPRHPAQLYEAICYLFSFFVLMYLYWRTNVKKKMGFIFGAFLILIFSARFIIEFVKEVQEPWEAGMALNMGQILSIPFILAGIFMLWYSRSCRMKGRRKEKRKRLKAVSYKLN